MEKGKSLGWAILLTGIAFLAKLVGGYMSNSLSLISDAWHLLTDLMSLILSWWAIKQVTKPPTAWATFGYPRVGILAALVNNLSLIFISFYILYEAYVRWLNPQTVESVGMLVLAALGLAVSGAIAYLVNDGAKNNLNMRSVWLHFFGEALASIGILLGGVVICFTSWNWIDTVLSALLGLTILRGACVMLWDIIVILLEGVPRNISVEEIRDSLHRIPYVKAARDIHVWCLADEDVALSAHIQVAMDVRISQTEPLLLEIKNILGQKYNINHVNIQFELQECRDCTHTMSANLL